MRKIILSIIVLIYSESVSAQNVLASAGNNQTSGAIQQSYTLGEVMVNDYRQSNKESSTGFQQPEIPQFFTRLFIQGFYLGGGMMTAVADPVNTPLLTDTITLSLYRTDRNPSWVFEKRVLLSTDGWCSVNIPSSLYGSSCYLVIKHRNSIETWSNQSLHISTFNKFDFTTP